MTVHVSENFGDLLDVRLRKIFTNEIEERIECESSCPNREIGCVFILKGEQAKMAFVGREQNPECSHGRAVKKKQGKEKDQQICPFWQRWKDSAEQGKEKQETSIGRGSQYYSNDPPEKPGGKVLHLSGYRLHSRPKK